MSRSNVLEIPTGIYSYQSEYWISIQLEIPHQLVLNLHASLLPMFSTGYILLRSHVHFSHTEWASFMQPACSLSPPILSCACMLEHVNTRNARSLSLADGWHGVSHTPTAACYYCSVCPKPKPCAATPLVLVWAEKEISHEFSTRNKNKWMKKFFAIIKVGLPRRVVCICFDLWWLWKSVHSNAYHRCIATGQSPRIRWRTRNNVQVSVKKAESIEKYPQKSRNTSSSV